MRGGSVQLSNPPYHAGCIAWVRLWLGFHLMSAHDRLLQVKEACMPRRRSDTYPEASHCEWQHGCAQEKNKGHVLGDQEELLAEK